MEANGKWSRRWRLWRGKPCAKDFPLHYTVQIGCGAHPAAYPERIIRPFPDVKRPGRDAEVKNAWIHTSTPLYIFVA
jgi:hypothetical protein